MKKKVFFWMCGAILMSSTLLVYFSQAAAQPPSGTLTVALSTMPDIYDPIMLGANDKKYSTLIFDSLVGMDHDGNINADMGLSHKWTRAPDAKTWTFYLRKGIKFHNGDELTAEDVKFSLERFRLPKAVSTHSRILKKEIESIEVVDPYTVRIHCKVPAPDMYYYLSSMAAEGYVFPKKYIQEKGDAYFSLNPIGTGPFKMIEVKSGQSIKMEAAFDSHWLYGPAKYKYVVFQKVPEVLNRIGMVKKGEADIAHIIPARIKDVEDSGLRVNYDPGASVCFISVHEQWVKSNPVHDKRVRQALALSLNAKHLREYLYAGVGRLSGATIIAKASLGHIDRPPYPYDPKRAKQLLREAGYPNGFKIKLHSFDVEWFPALPALMEATASYFEAIGVKTEIIPYATYSAFRAKIVDHKAEGGISGMEIGVKKNPLISLSVFFHSPGLLHYVESPELDEWIIKGNATLDEKERIELIQKIDQWMYDNYVALWSLELAWPYAISDRLEKWEMGLLSYDLNLEHVLMRNPRF